MSLNLLRLPTFADHDRFHVVVESPRGSSVKLKYDSKLGAISISRPLVLGLSYPYDWGFIPSTKGPDEDPIDAMVYWDVATFPGVVIPCTALAIVQIEQNGPSGRRVRNDRVIAMAAADRRSNADLLASLSAGIRDELANFFIMATVFESKDPKVLGWDGPEAAMALISQSS